MNATSSDTPETMPSSLPNVHSPKSGTGSLSSATVTANTTSTPSSPAVPPQQPIPAPQHGESHRVYWQQWLSTNEKSTGSRREWITSSAAVRITPEARALDVTNLLRETLGLNNGGGGSSSTTTTSASNNNTNNNSTVGLDALILVGTLYSLHNYVEFEHQQRHIATQYPQPSQRSVFIGLPTTNQSASASNKNLSPRRSSYSSALSSTARSSVPSSTGSNGDTSGAVLATTLSSTRPDPVHLVHTLHPTDSPLVIRDRMMQRIKELGAQQQQSNGKLSSPSTTNSSSAPRRSIMAPQLQWYFVPAIPPVSSLADTGPNNSSIGGSSGSGNVDSRGSLSPPSTNSSIPNCLHLEGYCTSMEEEGDDEDESSEDLVDAADKDPIEYDDETDDRDDLETQTEQLEARFPWLKNAEDATTMVDQEKACTEERRARRRARRELRRLHELATAHIAGAQQQPTVSGYLLKRSSRDRHLWRRVYCVLTNDYLWFITRVYTKRGGQQYARHGRLRLTRALLLQPAADYAPLYRTPYAFELITPDGTSHAFRAVHKDIQLQWIRVLSDRIVQSYENSLMEQAELIMADETLARSRRMEAIAVEPLCSNGDSASGGLESTTHRKLSKEGVLRWGLQVADYREYCRYVLSLLPAKSPVVVASTQRSSSPTTHAAATIAALSLAPEAVDPAVTQHIQASWAQASRLLVIISAGPPVEAASGDSSPTDVSSSAPMTYPRRIETIFRHIEYVITGRRLRGSQDLASATPTSHQSQPPPMDLFDPLLKELQALVL